jgi:transposase
VEIINEKLIKGVLKEPPVVTISYDEKPDIQALATTTPDLPPAPRKFRGHLRDYEYKRLGTVSLLAGLDLHTGRVTEIVSDHHASVDFIALLGKLDEGYPPQARIRLLLDNHSSHTSKETQGWLGLHPNRCEFVFTPKHGSWLNIVETMFSKMAETCCGVLVQREMERVRSPLVSIPPFGRGFSRHGGLSIRCVLGRARKGNFRAHEHRLDEPTRLSLGMVASLQSPLPFYLARSL